MLDGVDWNWLQDVVTDVMFVMPGLVVLCCCIPVYYRQVCGKGSEETGTRPARNGTNY